MASWQRHLATTGKPSDEDAGHAPVVDETPPLTNIAPSIFIPLRDDITKPLPEVLAEDRVEKLKIILDTVDTHRIEVRKNLVWMFEREKERRTNVALAQEAAQVVPEIRPALSSSEVDSMLANMDALTAELGSATQARLSTEATTMTNLATSRENLVQDLLMYVDQAVVQLEGYDGHMRQVKADFLGRLEQERRTMEEIGKRPEERSNAGNILI